MSIKNKNHTYTFVFCFVQNSLAPYTLNQSKELVAKQTNYHFLTKIGPTRLEHHRQLDPSRSYHQQLLLISTF